jgi:hypothetical protein
MGLRNRGQMGSASKKGKLSAKTKLMKIFAPFNAVYRHSMHRNTIQRKVWSRIANSGRLDAELLGAPRGYSVAISATCGAAQSRAVTEGEECRM